MTSLALIVAAAENDVIGRDNALPWRLPEDLRYFKRVTMGKPILMGRRTFESIGGPLSGRTSIIVTRNPRYEAAGAIVVSSLEQARAVADEIARRDRVEESVVIGGAQIYAAALPHVQRIYLTRVHALIEGDTRMPTIDWAQWREISRERHDAQAPGDLAFSFVCFERVAA